MKRIVVVAALALALSGCLPVTSTSPVGTTRGLGVDRRLAGMWEGSTDSGTPGWFAFVPDDHGGMTAILIGFPSTKDSDGSFETFFVRTAALGRAEYLNAQELTDNGRAATGPLAKNIMPLLYRFENERRLTLYLMDEEAAKKIVEAGRIAGVVEHEQFGDVTLTANPADLDRFFASATGLALFKKPFVVLTRVN